MAVSAANKQVPELAHSQWSAVFVMNYERSEVIIAVNSLHTQPTLLWPAMLMLTPISGNS